MTNYNERLDEILDRYGRKVTESGYLNEYFAEAKQAIDRLFLDAIGENEPTPQSIFDYGDDDQRKYWFNKLRRQLRTTITGKEGGE